MSDVELDVTVHAMAEERMNAAYKAFQYASDNANKAAAEVARLTLLKLADEIIGLSGMTFETQYEYNDEGGYFQTISCYPTYAEGTEESYDQYDFIDLMQGFGAEPICVLCDVPTDASEGEVTIEQARDRRF